MTNGNSPDSVKARMTTEYPWILDWRATGGGCTPLPKPPEPMRVVNGARYLHKKTRKIYTLIGVGVIEATMEDVAIYRGYLTGNLWVRPLSEFVDGRFELFDLD